jgi:hypothetical protein
MKGFQIQRNYLAKLRESSVLVKKHSSTVMVVLRNTVWVAAAMRQGNCCWKLASPSRAQHW